MYVSSAHMRRAALLPLNRLAALAALLALVSSASAQWEAEDSGTKSSLRGIHNASPGVAWASGANGVVLRSEDNGFLWQQCAIPPDAAKLDFRGVWGWNSNHAIVMSSGPGAASRLYETTDGCAHWRLLFTNPDPAGFWDAIAFWNEQQGMLLGDPVNGRFTIWRTKDTGRHWSRDASTQLAADPHGEGAFAASNSSLFVSPDGKDAYFGTGGPGGSRIFHFHSEGETGSGNWTSVTLPWTRRSETAGVFSIALRDAKHGIAVGGDYKQPNQRDGTAAWTSDAGITWIAASDPPAGYRSAVAWDQTSHAWIAVGPTGSDASYDDGKTWKQFDTAGWNAMSLPWAAGGDGKIATLKKSAIPSLPKR
jgi:photosystem II stability/assembly factor-like uncharacterized protein